MSCVGKKSYSMIPHSSLHDTYLLNSVCNVRYGKKSYPTTPHSSLYAVYYLRKKDTDNRNNMHDKRKQYITWAFGSKFTEESCCQAGSGGGSQKEVPWFALIFYRGTNSVGVRNYAGIHWSFRLATRYWSLKKRKKCYTWYLK